MGHIGSVVNGMFFDRASRADYDAWRQLGNPGWGWSDLLPYFIKSTNFSEPSPEVAAEYNYTWDRSVWGHDGPIHASIAPFQWPELPNFLNAWKDISSQLEPGQAPIRFPRDGASGDAVGVIWAPNSQDPTTETRSSARNAYYDPVAHRPNLHLITGTKVKKVTFCGKTATGVQMTKRGDNTTVSIQARKEVIIAAGPVFSPNVLQLSGIGSRTMLEAAGITVVQDLPGVGMNFQDHPTAYLSYNFTRDFYPNPGVLQANASYNAMQRALYFKNRTGPYIQTHGNSAAFLSLSTVSTDAAEIVAAYAKQNTSQYLPAIYDATSRAGYAKQHAILTALLNSTEAAMYELPFTGSSFLANAMERPVSRGTITLNVSDPTAPPVVDWNTLADPTDARLVVEMLKFTRRYFNTSTFAETLAPIEILPGANVTTDVEILASLKAKLLVPSFAHWSCSCPMMPLELGGVVSPELEVYGVERLSVIDSSIFPLIPATHLCGTVYAVAEKAADIIKARSTREVYGHGGYCSV
jgi:choline dehydrogenase-like flavoprotein